VGTGVSDAEKHDDLPLGRSRAHSMLGWTSRVPQAGTRRWSPRCTGTVCPLCALGANHPATVREVNGWAIAAGLGVLGLAAIRELVRWRGRRWQKSGHRGTEW